jgi:glycosyltransferase involved in cell wall biosynthesis
VLFVLPSRGSSGGANSVVQECLGLTALGVRAAIAVDAANAAAFAGAYPELGAADAAALSYDGVEALAALGSEFDIMCATTNASMFDVADARGEARVAYYVQDYEPLFYPPDTPAWERARRSYGLVRDAAAFAKTRWLCNITYANHGVQVSKVEPSIDHDVFFPALGRSRPTLNVTAMIRPQTPRRAPQRTLRILDALRRRYGGDVRLQVFGADPKTLDAHGLALPEEVVNLGVLRRTQVPALLRDTDLLLDLSDYQAFGRTALEAMACGALAVAPLLGGTAEFARHGQNGFVVDTRSDDAIIEAVHQFVRMTNASRDEMRLLALETASRFTVRKAALSELRVFKRLMG